MNNPSSATAEKSSKDETYLQVWDIEQRHTTARWTITTFFLSVSFAIFGISLQAEKAPVPLIVSQLAALAIYWFAYLLFLRFNDYTGFLRVYLKEMESSQQTTLQLQTKSVEIMKSKGRPSATQLLLLFGIVYTVAGIAIGIFF